MGSAGLPHKAWVVVADGEKALFLVNDGDERDMNLRVQDKEEQDNPAARDWASDRAGRFNDGPSVHRSAVEETDWHRLEKERFAADLAERFNKAALEGRFDTLAIVASRVVLSELRERLHSEAVERIVFEVPKVLTNHPLDEIERLLARDIAKAE